MNDQEDADVRISLSNDVIHRINKGTKHQISYEQIIYKLANIRLAKAKMYGESRYEGHNPEFNFWMTFCDVHRKYIRLQQLNQLCVDGDESAFESIIDCYADLANYAIMAIQLIEPLTKEKEVESDN